MAEGGGLLNRYRVVKPYRGFESLRLRHPRSSSRGAGQALCRFTSKQDRPPTSGLRQVIEPGARSSRAAQARFAIDRRKAYIWIHAHSGFSGSVDRNALGNGTGASSGLRSKFPGLPANLRPRWRQYRLQLYIAASVQCVGFGPRGAMPDQSIFRTSDKKASRRGALSLTF